MRRLVIVFSSITTIFDVYLNECKIYVQFYNEKKTISTIAGNPKITHCQGFFLEFSEICDDVHAQEIVYLRASQTRSLALRGLFFSDDVNEAKELTARKLFTKKNPKCIAKGSLTH